MDFFFFFFFQAEDGIRDYKVTGVQTCALPISLHLVRSQPAGSARAVDLLRMAATGASGRGAPGTAADYLRRALAEPPNRAARPAVLLDLGLALARERSPAAPAALREAVELTGSPQDRATAAMLAVRVLGLWGYHESVIAICRAALAAPAGLEPAAADRLEAELFANAWPSEATAAPAQARARCCLAYPGTSSAWSIHAALSATVAGQPASDVLAMLAPVLDSEFTDVAPDSLTAVYGLLALIWNDELGTARGICDAVLAGARARGSLSMVAHTSCLRSMIMRRLGQFEVAAAGHRLGGRVLRGLINLSRPPRRGRGRGNGRRGARAASGLAAHAHVSPGPGRAPAGPAAARRGARGPDRGGPRLARPDGRQPGHRVVAGRCRGRVHRTWPLP